MPVASSEPFRVFWSSAVIARKALFAWLSPAMWIMQLFFMSLFQIAFFVFVAQFSNNPNITIAYVAVGNALQSIAYVAVFSVCNITGEEKDQGTLPGLIASPANRFSVFVGRAMFQIFNSMLTVIIAFFYAAFLFGVDFSNVNLLSLALVIAITSFAMTGFGLMLSSFGLYLRTSMVLANIFLFAGLLFCGVNFPISYLPEGLRFISYIFPMTYGTDAARAAVNGSSVEGIAGLLGQELLVGMIAIIFGYGMMKLFEHIARSKGTLERS